MSILAGIVPGVCVCAVLRTARIRWTRTCFDRRQVVLEFWGKLEILWLLQLIHPQMRWCHRVWRDLVIINSSINGISSAAQHQHQIHQIFMDV